MSGKIQNGVTNAFRSKLLLRCTSSHLAPDPALMRADIKRLIIEGPLPAPPSSGSGKQTPLMFDLDRGPSSFPRLFHRKLLIIYKMNSGSTNHPSVDRKETLNGSWEESKRRRKNVKTWLWTVSNNSDARLPACLPACLCRVGKQGCEPPSQAGSCGISASSAGQDLKLLKG